MPNRHRRRTKTRTIRAALVLNFLDNHGVEQFDWFIIQLESGISYADIARGLGVTRQRVHQWANVFGTMRRTYTLDNEVLNVLGERASGEE